MRWEAHTRTAQKILAGFDAYHFQKYEKDLINGIIYPDSNDPKPHRRVNEAIIDNIKRARERRLEYNPSDSFFYLGMAFHYIQDSWVVMDPDNEDYPKYENQMDKSQILDMGEDLFKYYPVSRRRVLIQFKDLDARLKVPLKSPEEMFALVSSGVPFESTAFLAVNMSYRVCHRISEMVLKPMLKTSLDENLARLHIEYTEKLVERESIEQESLYKLEEDVGTESQGLLSGLQNWKKKKDLDKRYSAYGKGLHLKKIFKSYDSEAETMSKPYVEWYNVKIPELVLPEIDPEAKAEPSNPLVVKRDDPVVSVN